MLACRYLYFQLFSHRTLFEEPSDPEGGAPEEDEEILSLHGSCCWLAVATVLIAVLSETLTATLTDAGQEWGLGSQFVGFVILPIVGNAAEHSTAIVTAPPPEPPPTPPPHSHLHSHLSMHACIHTCYSHRVR